MKELQSCNGCEAKGHCAVYNLPMATVSVTCWWARRKQVAIGFTNIVKRGIRAFRSLSISLRDANKPFEELAKVLEKTKESKDESKTEEHSSK